MTTAYFKDLSRLFLLCLVLIAPASFAANDIRTERVHFKKGSSSAVIEASIKGYQTVDYVLGARAGQHMNVSLATKHGATCFNILTPGQNEVAMFNGSMNDNQYEGTLPATGDYKIRVYMMRSAARRNEVADYRLEMSIDGSGQPMTHTNEHDAKVAGTDYHATGMVSCTLGKEQSSINCNFGVKREGNGSGMVTVTKPDASTRVIFFQNGRATGYDQSQADAADFRSEKKSDMNIIHIGKERYEIPDAVIFGG